MVLESLQAQGDDREAYDESLSLKPRKRKFGEDPPPDLASLSEVVVKSISGMRI